MAKLSTLHSSVTQRCLIFGAPKTGKSQLAGELAEHFNLIWVDLENGHDVLFKLPIEWQERVELISIPDTRDHPIAIETCLKMVKGAVEICEEHGKVSCMLCKRANLPTINTNLPKTPLDTIVVFDSATQLSNSAIAHITKTEKDDYKLDWADWNHLGVLMDKFFSFIQQSKYNVIVISHEVEAETEGKKRTLVPVAGTRNFSRNVAKYFDHVVYAQRKLNAHEFASSTTYNTTILTGSRTDVVMEDAEKPSLLAIFKPELYADNETKLKKNKPSVPVKTNDILSRLKAKAKNKS